LKLPKFAGELNEILSLPSKKDEKLFALPMPTRHLRHMRDNLICANHFVNLVDGGFLPHSPSVRCDIFF
jgi:hypothetical protein